MSKVTSEPSLSQISLAMHLNIHRFNYYILDLHPLDWEDWGRKKILIFIWIKPEVQPPNPMVVPLQSLQWFRFLPGFVFGWEHIQNPDRKVANKSGTWGSIMILHVTLLLLEEGWLHMTPIIHSSRPFLRPYWYFTQVSSPKSVSHPL